MYALNGTPTLCLGGLLRDSHQCAQQSGNSAAHFIVGALEGAEADGSHRLQVGRVQERGVPHHLQQTLCTQPGRMIN